MVLGLALVMAAAGCGHLHQVNPDNPAACYTPQGPAPELVARFAPAFVVHQPQADYNRIGSPAARPGPGGEAEIYMDPDKPVIYYQVRGFVTQRGKYTNLLYRVHFPGVPASLWPPFLGWGRNMGLFTVITLNQAQEPVLITSVATCGCYLALVATGHTPAEALPVGFDGQPQGIYGETLPARLDYSGGPGQRLVVEIRPGEHRVMGLKVEPAAKLAEPRLCQDRPTPLRPNTDLFRIPYEGKTVSLFHEGGFMVGHVKGAYKPMETLTLGLASWDWFVGMDKQYGHPANLFHTSLKPWARWDSDMNDFPRFLRYWGWRL